MSLFKGLGILMGLYTIYAAVQGEVYAKSGIHWACVTQADNPYYFRMVIAIYAGLSLALVFLF